MNAIATSAYEIPSTSVAALPSVSTLFSLENLNLVAAASTILAWVGFVAINFVF